MRKIGAHVSASGGVDKAIERAKAIGCNCVQVFSASPRVWQKPALSTFDAKKIEQAKSEYAVQPIVTHALYLINLASDNPQQIEKSINSLIFELQFDHLVKGAGVVVHLGSHQGRGWDAVKESVAKNITTILEKTPEESTFLIENSAGQNGKLTSDLRDIRWLFDQVKSPRLRWCVDTCHLFCAGYRLNPHSKVKSEGTKLSMLLQGGQHDLVAEETISKLDLWSKLGCVHVNDSRDPFGSGKDRHENVNDGYIPSEDLSHFLHIKELAHAPLILEVPGIEGEGPDSENVRRLTDIISR